MHIYSGLFFIAFSSLCLEISLVRILSVTSWYYLAFFAISTAMLGMTAGATRVYLYPNQYTPEKMAVTAAETSIYLSISIPLTLLIVCLTPMILTLNIMGFFSILITTAACSLPFYFIGCVITLVLTKGNLPIGRLYACDLSGASLGCLFVLFGLEILDAPSFILMCSSVVALAALLFMRKEQVTWLHPVAVSLVGFFFFLSIFNTITEYGIRPMIMKGLRIEVPSQYFFERWNSFSRVAVYKKEKSAPPCWGPSSKTPQDPIDVYFLNIDGEAGTAMSQFQDLKDIQYLKYDVTNIGYYLHRPGKACIIGVGGGRDIQSAILFGYKEILGIEINPIFIDILNKDLRQFAGIVDYPGVNLVTAEARSYLSNSQKRFGFLQMSLIDTWASTGAGAFSLSENTLYTREAWRVFLDRLTEDGIFTVSRWYNPDGPHEIGRLVSLAVAALLEKGIQNPEDHLALIGSQNIATLLISPSPFSTMDLAKLELISQDLEYFILYLPHYSGSNAFLRSITSAGSYKQLVRIIRDADLNLMPPTDENPYFFNMLKLKHLSKALDKNSIILAGNLTANISLIVLVLALSTLAFLAIILPLFLKKKRSVTTFTPSKVLISGASYFILIGAGFMLTEIALIQRLGVLLSHPMYSLGILLFGLIASTGVGSYLSDRLPLTDPPWLFIYPVIMSISLIALPSLINYMVALMYSEPIVNRALASIALIAPLGLILGCFFPSGMRLVKTVSSADTPWFWALNGIFGVLFSAIAVFIAIHSYISMNFYLASGCYMAVIIPQIIILRSKKDGSI